MSSADRKENVMPIRRKDFDESIDTLSEEVLRFLKSNADEAFNLEELTEAVGGRQLEVWAVLDELKRKEQISSKCIKGNGYYCIGK
jgi:hypothetical protein